jgi:hypothetical protein
MEWRRVRLLGGDAPARKKSSLMGLWVNVRAVKIASRTRRSASASR